MTDHFPISKSEAASEIRQLIVASGLDNLTSKIIRMHLETKFKCNLESPSHKSDVDDIIREQIETMKAGTTKANANTEPLGTCVTDTSVIPSSSSAIHRHPPQNVSNGDEVTSDDSDSDKSDSSYGAQSNAKAEALPPKNRKRAANGVSKATSQPTESISDEDMASVVKRRRGTRTKQRREVQKKDQRKSTVKEDSKKSSGKKKTAYGRVCVLSDDLANLIGKRYMRRSDVVKWMWAYFNSNDLKDPKNRQFIILDEPLKKVFGQSTKRIKGFSMMQKLCKHIKDAEFLDSATRQKIEAELAAEENNDVTETSVKSDDGDDSRMENDDEDNHVAKAAIVDEEEKDASLDNVAEHFPIENKAIADQESLIKKESDRESTSDSSNDDDGSSSDEE